MRNVFSSLENLNEGSTIYLQLQLHLSTLSAAASFDDHVLIVFKDDLVEVVDVKHADGRQLRRDAARPGNGSGVDRVDEYLHYGMIRRVEVVGEGKRAVAVAVIGVIPGRRYDPIVPPDVREIHVKSVSPALALHIVIFISPSVLFILLIFPRPPPLPVVGVASLTTAAPVSIPALGIPPIVAVSHEQRRRFVPGALVPV